MNSGNFTFGQATVSFVIGNILLMPAEFHYNTFEKTKVFNEFHIYDSSNDFYTNRIYLKLRRLVSI